jgi:hypothetical protein
MKLLFKFTKQHFCKRLTGYDKMDLILEQQKADKQKHQEEYKIIEKKSLNLVTYTQIFRSPLYISTFLQIWENPLTKTYTHLFLFSNYYLILITALEGSILFSHALVYYNIVKSTKQESLELMNARLKSNRKRLFILITFFTGLIVALKLTNSGSPVGGLVVIFLLNFYLYAKVSIHITTKLVNNITYMPRMKFIYTNMLFSLILIGINSYKRKFVKNNITF